MNRTGATLMELLTSVILVVSVVVTVALVFPNVSKSQLRTRQHHHAVMLAESRVEEIKKNPYSRVEVTPDLLLDPNCDCRTVNYANWFVPPPNVQPVTSNAAATVYQERWCVNQVQLVGTTWDPECSGNDTGYKHILVDVRWTRQGEVLTTRQEGLVTRY